MNAKRKEKRAIKGYKIRPSVYRKAKARATKNKFPLASLIECWLEVYAIGGRIDATPPKKPGVILDIDE